MVINKIERTNMETIIITTFIGYDDYVGKEQIIIII